MPPEVSIIIPTYREAENLPVLVPRIHQALQGAGLDGEIIVVDDNSPDSTAEVCSHLARSHPLRLETRHYERGLASAVVHGMRMARGRVLVCMDADLSHPPEAIPQLVSPLRDGADFVIGSRYVKGGSTDSNWGIFRWLNSKVATVLAWPLTAARDPMAGFFALRRETFEEARQLDPIGYKIGLELLVKCGCRSIREVPIAFQDRLYGQTKLTVQEQINYLRHLKRLYEYKLGGWARFAQFVVVGASGAVVDLLAYWLLLGVIWLPVARALAIWAAMTWNFQLNRRFTFSYAKRRPIAVQYLAFCAACLIGALINWTTSLGLRHTHGFFARHLLLAAVIGIVAGTGWNYLLSAYVVFRRGRKKTRSDVPTLFPAPLHLARSQPRGSGI